MNEPCVKEAYADINKMYALVAMTYFYPPSDSIFQHYQPMLVHGVSISLSLSSLFPGVSHPRVECLEKVQLVLCLVQV